MAEGAAGASEGGEQKANFNDIFSLKRPKDAKSGLASGLKSVGRGIVGGMVGLIAAPVVGASQEGLSGFAKGIATGVAGAVILPVTGMSVGVVQIVRGVVAQAEAVVDAAAPARLFAPTAAAAANQLAPWDAPRAHLPWAGQPRGRGGGSGADGSNGVADNTTALDYYALLGLTRAASADDVRRRYYELARRLHPDKAGGDAAAVARFQAVGEAYQVLCNPALRARYDAHGDASVGAGLMDGAAFYSCLFGSSMFDYLLGELVIATVAESNGEIGAAELLAAQAARVEQLAVNLRAVLRRYVDGDAAGFRASQRAEAERLARASFGPTLLDAIGRVYCTHADIHLGGLLDGALARVRQGREAVRSHLAIASSAFRLFMEQERLADFDRGYEERQAQRTQQRGSTGGGGGGAGSDGGDGEAASGSSSGGGISSASRRLHEWYVGSGGGSGGQARTQQRGASSSAAGRGAAAAADVAADAYASWPERVAAAAAAAAASSAHVDSGGSWGGGGGSGGRGSGSFSNPTPPTTPPSGSARPQQAQQPPQQSQEAMEELLRRRQLEDESIESVVAAMWAANVVDIQRTLGQVCAAVLGERGAARGVCAARAAALRETGRVFCAVAAASAARQDAEAAAGSVGSGGRARQQLEAALEAAMAKRVAQEEEEAAVAAAAAAAAVA